MKKQILLVDARNAQILYQGLAEVLIDDKHTSVKIDDPVLKSEFRLFEKGVQIINNTDLKTSLPLFLNKKTKAKIESEYGILEIPLFLDKYERKKNEWQIRYTLGEDEENIFHFLLHIEEDKYEN